MKTSTFFALAVLVASFDAWADDVAQPVPSNKTCSITYEESSIPQEQFVWKRVCVGDVADFNEGTEFGGIIDPRTGALPDKRILTSTFLETILLKDKYRKALTRNGVRIVGARFVETINLENAELRHALWLSKSSIEKGVNFSWMRSAHPIGFDGSKFGDAVKMYEVEIGADLAMKHVSASDEINLEGAHIGGRLDFEGSTVVGSMRMAGIRVDGILFMHFGANFADIDLVGGSLGQTLELTGSKVTKLLDMYGLRVSGALYMNGSDATFDYINLQSARIGGLVDLEKAKFNKKVNCQSMEVGETVFLNHQAEFLGPIQMAFAKIKGNLELGGGMFHQDIDGTGIQVGGALRLGSATSNPPEPAVWIGGARLILANARAEVIPGLTDAWPDTVNVSGFTYSSLADGQVTANALQNWLAKQGSYSPQVYEQLASVLRGQGQIRNGNDVLYASRERERQQATFAHRAWLTATKCLIGYGYHLERSLVWIIIFLAAGIIVMWSSGQGWRNGLSRFGVAYSFDMLLPIIRLREKHYEIDLPVLPRCYFYVHRVAGYILASFLIAGLSGLAK